MIKLIPILSEIKIVNINTDNIILLFNELWPTKRPKLLNILRKYHWNFKGKLPEFLDTLDKDKLKSIYLDIIELKKSN